jgi:hypothetical protein
MQYYDSGFKRSGNSWRVILAETLLARRPNLFPEYILQKLQSIAPCMVKVVQYNHLLLGSLANHPEEWCHIEVYCWFLLLAIARLTLISGSPR